MRALVYEAPHTMPVRDIPVPTPQPDEVLIKVAYSGICGSELSGYEGKNALRKPPLI
ncbi:MAG: alcohol dehydrogenase, partial [Phototrophicales bacterium]